VSGCNETSVLSQSQVSNRPHLTAPRSVFSGKGTLPPEQEAVFASSLFAVSPLGWL